MVRSNSLLRKLRLQEDIYPFQGHMVEKNIEVSFQALITMCLFFHFPTLNMLKKRECILPK